MPLLSSWSHTSTEEMEDLHEVACLRKHQDANAKHVMTMMQSSYDWHSLTKGIPVLKEALCSTARSPSCCCASKG